MTKVLCLISILSFVLILPLTIYSTRVDPFSISKSRTFTIDYENNCFLKDGKPFKYYSGSFHYFRSPPEFWSIRLKAMRMAGLDAVETYIEWSTIEPEKGQYNFSGRNDFVRFVEIAQEIGLLVILRPGPYICAERDLGGFPAWLQWEHPNMTFRTNDQDFEGEIERWFSVLLPKIKPLMYHNGGPVIMVQVENEYGSVNPNSMEYKLFMRDLLRKHLGEETLLFTTDGNWPGYVQRGYIPEVYPTIDFGVKDNITAAVENYRKLQPQGPLVNSEFYVGWLDHWSELHSVIDTEDIINQMIEMQAYNFSANFYMFFGGTNFEWSPGANFGKTFEPDPTSYDYDAPISESGELTEKYYAIRQFILSEKIANNLSIEDIEAIKLPKLRTIKLPKVAMEPIGNIFDIVSQKFSRKVQSVNPLTFEDLKHPNGFVIYTTELNVTTDFSLEIDQISDRALVYLDQIYVGKLSRTLKTTKLNVTVENDQPKKLQILVENQGRINYGEKLGEKKGILSKVLINGRYQTGWEHETVYDEWNALRKFVVNSSPQTRSPSNFSTSLPTFFFGRFVLPKDTPPMFQTYLSFRLGTWHKGIVFINDENLGRYWPFTGPQKTLYIPSVFFKPYPQENELFMLELEGSSSDPKTQYIDFVSKPHINSKVIPD